MIQENRKWLGSAAAVFAFAVFLLVALHKLTYASVWVDESIEFWYSRVMTGPLPFENTSDMIERINSTFQPPLYNFLMFFWLQISTGQWWFRFFGVVAGFFGMIGLYKTARLITGNVYAASASVLVAAFVRQLVYYWQECAEYCLLVAFIFWALYYWISLLKKPSRNNIIGLTVFSVLAVYSQYGAVFPVFIMLVTALFTVLRQKQKVLTRTLLISYGTAFVVAALPLFFFFFLPQFASQHEGGFSAPEITFFRNNVLIDFAGGAAAVFEWCFTSFLPQYVTAVIVGLFVLLAAVTLFRGSRFLKTVILSNLCLWLIYYAALKLKLYAYGSFRGRYAIFFIPCWLVMTVAMLYEVYGLLAGRDKAGKGSPAKIWLGAVALACAALSFCSWQLSIKDNWVKENNRESTAVWYRENPEGKDTFVYYGAAAGFAYYLYNDPAYSSVPRERIRYMPWQLRGKTAEEYTEYYDKQFGPEWPKEVYFVAQHIGSDLDVMLTPFLDRGYRRESLNGRWNIRLVLDD